MARYLLEKNAFIGNAFHRAGDIVDFDGEPGPHMTLLDEQKTQPVKTVTKKGKRE